MIFGSFRIVSEICSDRCGFETIRILPNSVYHNHVSNSINFFYSFNHFCGISDPSPRFPLCRPRDACDITHISLSLANGAIWYNSNRSRFESVLKGRRCYRQCTATSDKILDFHVFRGKNYSYLWGYLAWFAIIRIYIKQKTEMDHFIISVLFLTVDSHFM